MFTYLWVAVLGQDLQHRRFSALNISHKNQFTSHHQRLVISPFLHYVIINVQCFAEIYIYICIYKKKNRPNFIGCSDIINDFSWHHFKNVYKKFKACYSLMFSLFCLNHCSCVKHLTFFLVYLSRIQHLLINITNSTKKNAFCFFKGTPQRPLLPSIGVL